MVYKCSISVLCTYTTNWKFALDDHEVTHDNKCNVEIHNTFSCENKFDILKCSTCPYQTFSFTNLLRHSKPYYLNLPSYKKLALQNIDKEINNIFKKYIEECLKCKQCSFLAKTKVLLKKHIYETHIPEEEIVYYRCENCPFKAKKRPDLLLHVKKHHTPFDQAAWHICNDCYFVAQDLKSLNGHIARRHRRPSNVKLLLRLCCPKCPYKTHSKSSLRNHRIVKHTPDNEIVWIACQEKGCEYKGKTKDYLVQHVKNMHTCLDKLELLECYICNYQCKNKTRLTEHIYNNHRRHEEMKWFPCLKCPLKSKKLRELKIHQFRKHTTASVKNEWIEKYFTQSNGKNNFSEIDKYKKTDPWYCKECLHYSKTKANLMSHVIRVHIAKL